MDNNDQPHNPDEGLLKAAKSTTYPCNQAHKKWPPLMVWRMLRPAQFSWTLGPSGPWEPFAFWNDKTLCTTSQMKSIEKTKYISGEGMVHSAVSSV